MGGDGSPPHGNGGPLGRGSKPLGGGGDPPGRGGPLSGGFLQGFPVGGTNVPFGALWPGNLWNPWYPPLAPTTPMAPSSRKSLPYPIYYVGTNLDAHVQVFKKAIQANGEKQDVNIMNLFCFTLMDAILE